MTRTITTSTTSKLEPPWRLEHPWWDSGLVDWLGTVKPEDLPECPWVLHASKPQPIGKSFFRGGPYVRVIGNENFLHHLRQDVARGPKGPRAGSVMDDLRALKRVLDEEKVRRERGEQGGQRG